MPFFDRICPSCRAERRDCFEPVEPPAVLCADCGEPTERAWLSKPSNILRDEIHVLQRNGCKTPTLFTSRIERSRWLKENNYRECGDGESKGSKSGDCMDPVTMANAAELVARAATAPTRNYRDPDKAPIGITSDEGVIRFLRDQGRAEFRGEYGFSGR